MTIALIDNHPVFRTGIRTILTSQFENVVMLETGSIQSFSGGIQQEAVDIIIIGLSEEQPEIDRSALKKAIKNNPMAAVILYYAHNPGFKFASSLIRSGVKGFLIKSGGASDLAVCVNSILSGEPYVCHHVRALA
ncbi:response regulator [Dyadobacter aurulentus]|uniref:response regulator n=1 Tax=Dyadobacter sp. UC 10 TaxID=2605428 RepID=UPI0011F22F77|nr:response regulator [Dyadobacter sp. UC 10]KAA0988689.1 response regulator transcription factor [Dyadobacter sp. UC 10]